MSLAREGNSCLYTYNVRTAHQRQLSFGNVIDTSPCYSPDGKNIVFNSNRGGSRTHIYTMSAKGGDIKRISHGEGSYRTPVGLLGEI